MFATVSPFHTSSICPVSVTSPITAKSSSHFLEDRLGLGFPAGLQDHEHALLALAEHHFVGRHAVLAHGPCSCRSACRRRPCSPSRREHVSPAAPMSWMATIASGSHSSRHASISNFSVNGRRPGRSGASPRYLRRNRRWPGRAVDSVAAGLGADVDDRIADARGGRVENLVGLRDAHRHRVDEDVAVVAASKSTSPPTVGTPTQLP